MLAEGTIDVASLAKREGFDRTYIAKVVRATFLNHAVVNLATQDRKLALYRRAIACLETELPSLIGRAMASPVTTASVHQPPRKPFASARKYSRR
jgi:hypothetical protein